MKLNIWKVSTFVFGGALVLLVGTGSVRTTAACDMEDAPVNRSVQFLRAALTSVDRAESQLKAVDSDGGGHRAKALGHLTLAMDEIEKGIVAASMQSKPKPKPRPRPAKGETALAF